MVWRGIEPISAEKTLQNTISSPEDPCFSLKSSAWPLWPWKVNQGFKPERACSSGSPWPHATPTPTQASYVANCPSFDPVWPTSRRHRRRGAPYPSHLYRFVFSSYLYSRPRPTTEARNIWVVGFSFGLELFCVPLFCSLLFSSSGGSIQSSLVFTIWLRIFKDNVMHNKKPSHMLVGLVMMCFFYRAHNVDATTEYY